MSTEVTVGKLLVGNERRDAIHFALAPVIADTKLFPGQRIGFIDGSQERVCAALDTGESVRCLGILDPFLRHFVVKDQKCWMFLLPNTVTGMRHQWEHPAFSADPGLVAASDISVSEQWLRDYATRHNPYRDPAGAYRYFIQSLREGAIHFDGDDLHSFDELPDAAELQRHAEIVLGRRVDLRDFDYSCSC